MRSWRLVLLLAVCVAAAGSHRVDAQEIVAIPFSFSAPGARALGLGNAFIAVADDATASEANPAGLTILTRSEASIHVRDADFDLTVFSSGPVFLEANTGEVLPIEDSFVPLTGSRTSVSFASFVKPFQRFVTSLYYYRSVDFEGSSLWEEVGQDQKVYSEVQAYDFLLENVGLSAAFQVGDKISLGLSIRQSQLSAQGLSQLGEDGEVEGRENVFDDDDSDFTWNAGLMFNPRGRWSVGLVYKENGSYEIDYSRRGTVRKEEFNIPSFVGAGVRWRATDQFLLSAEINRIFYSDLPRFLDDLPDDYPDVVEEVNDETELHMGLEYTFLAAGGRTPISVRGGFFTDPDHDGLKDVDSDQVHWTLGLGFFFKQRFQLNLAARSSNTINEALISFVYQF